jgi:hypothetical protein
MFGLDHPAYASAVGEQQLYGRGRNNGWKRSLIIASIVVGSVLVLGVGTAVVFTAVTVVTLFHPFASNAAEAESKPFNAALEKDGGAMLCSNGDAGYGPDNLVPWSTVYYLVPESGGVSDDLKRTAAAQGYPLTPTGGAQDDQTPTADEAFASGERVRIFIYRDADVPLYCSDVEQYGDKHHVGGDDAIVEVDITLPSRQIE